MGNQPIRKFWWYSLCHKIRLVIDAKWNFLVVRTFWLLLVSFIVATASQTRCSHPDYAIALPNGYELVRGNDVDIAIIWSKHTNVIGGTIVRYAVVANRYVVGEEDTTEIKLKAPHGFPVGKGGWFLIDTQARTVQIELSESDWREKVLPLNDGKMPKLTVPEGIKESLAR